MPAMAQTSQDPTAPEGRTGNPATCVHAFTALDVLTFQAAYHQGLSILPVRSYRSGNPENPYQKLGLLARKRAESCVLTGCLMTRWALDSGCLANWGRVNDNRNTLILQSQIENVERGRFSAIRQGCET